MGDFNINLLSYEFHPDTNAFLNIRFLIIDFLIFNHFPQFLVVNKLNIDYKRCFYSKRDFSKFKENNLVSNFSNTDNSFLNDSNIDLDCKFERSLTIFFLCQPKR